MASLSLQHINKTYPNGFEAVKDFNLEIEDKEFIIFVLKDETKIDEALAAVGTIVKKALGE